MLSSEKIVENLSKWVVRYGMLIKEAELNNDVKDVAVYKKELQTVLRNLAEEKCQSI